MFRPFRVNFSRFFSENIAGITTGTGSTARKDQQIFPFFQPLHVFPQGHEIVIDGIFIDFFMRIPQ
jgi:hypothetical protein